MADEFKAVTDAKVDLDSVPVHNIQHIESTVFDITLPADNIGGCAAGVYSPAVDDGYYLRLDPLKVGNHTLHIVAAAGTGSSASSLDVTYHLTVVPLLEQ